ncbi:family S53 protease-like protein [Cordyceps fumosorosea ARSEF 2679]|uniref:tripeptidyl-peptidase II n=1 Tax=Cordyceps fumosorosea (strain ARSEF 2679) TaxID=1081104 RepID=A0A167PAN0_CORFA|nr:family S53 protease-like protein [Cordyceps fumosorosea ARSEF 2679]OAA56464.1 family S53 protease-like protein [Cordyceps fumosorosea ARSEF 2679]
MVAWSRICLALSTVGGAYAAPSAANHGPLTLFSEIKQIPSKWQSTGAAAKSALIKGQIGLKQGDIKGLEAKLLDISNPSSENYGKWLSQDEVAKYTAPAEGSVDAVKSWLAAHGISETSQPTNDWIEFTAPVSQMESLLGTQYEWFTHDESGITIPRTTKYLVPQALHDHIDMITPTTAFYNAIGAHAAATEESDVVANAVERRDACLSNGHMTPACINQHYNVDYTAKGTQLCGTTGLIGIGANHTDYATFGNAYVSGLKDFSDVTINNAPNSGNGTEMEGNLDTQYMGGLCYPNPSVYLSAGPTGAQDSQFGDALANIASYLTSTSNPPSVVSTSYGGEENGFDGDYMDRVCNEFMKAGSLGITLTLSTGDHGVAANGETSCYNNGFYAMWPASCPYVTAVGGTQFGSSGEVVANFQTLNKKYTSPGGGYSWHFSAPDYSKNVTTAYANSLDSSYNGYLNTGGRGYPDISLVSVNFETYINGQLYHMFGTSASSPSVAAFIGVLNDYRNSTGKSTLGFINPLLYSSTAATAIRDITSGNNFGCGLNGFYAGTGWDAASGLGSLDFGKLRAVI